jgi:hypothetical protein
VIRQGNGAKENSKILSIFQGDQIKYHCNLKILMGPFLNINSFFFLKKKKKTLSFMQNSWLNHGGREEYYWHIIGMT